MRGMKLTIAAGLALAATVAAAVEWTSPQIRSNQAEDSDLVMVYRPSATGAKTLDLATLADPFRRYTTQRRLLKGTFDQYTAAIRRELTGKEATGTAAAAMTAHLSAANHPATTSNLPEGTNLYFTTGRASAAAPVQSVASKTGAVTLTPTDIGLATTCTGRSSWDGIDGTQIYYGTTVPDVSLGVVSDFYINSATWNLYRKEGTPTATWTLKGNMVGPANTLAIGTVTTLAYNQQATATITGTAPNQTLSLGLVQGVPGDPGTLTRKNITDKIVLADDTIIYIQPATNSATAGGIVVNDFGGNAAIILQNGRIEVRDTGGITIAKIDRAAGTMATYDTTGNLSASLDRSGGIYGYKASNVVGMSWTRATGALVLY